MECYICHDEIESGVAEEVIHCMKHQFHSECYMLWRSQSPLNRRKEYPCAVCENSLQETEVAKLSNRMRPKIETLTELAGSDDIDGLIEHMKYLSQKDFGYRFTDMVTSAVAPNAYKVLRYLKAYEMKHRHEYNRHDLVDTIARKMTKAGFRWILNDFKVQLPESLNPDPLCAENIQIFKKAGAATELLWVCEYEFNKLEENLLIDISTFLYEASLNGKLSLALLSRYSPFEGGILKLVYGECNWESQCRFVKVVYPAVIVGKIKDKDQLEKADFFTIMGDCRRCSKSHIWDFVKVVIEKQDLKLLVLLSQHPELFKKGPKSYKEIAKLVQAHQCFDEVKYKNVLESLPHFKKNSLKWKFAW